ncbi:hydrogenase expression/formation protein HypE [Thiothrix litoralis]|jgi:hydrogenase expression/formation protein HypE|uniref:Hydrogenase expression/formation protein HypE n=1 Tax=Thiothrix litoralis TaxID=2891210 RepID=A0ABX7WP45_9GAMM|nr:hydrogenase expression/formation protein HypE [Thiothrix litoralis]QTR44761.1 hydrogenase expression/formation protein HypE [Thiothrix litoralis]
MNLTGTITLAHGSGGRAMHQLVDDLIRRTFSNPLLEEGEDQARIPLAQLTAQGDRLAFTTDSYVVTPLEFPGGNIGTLAINGTVNDLAVGGAKPLYLSCGFIIEEGLPLETFARILQAMRLAADEAGVQIVTGDTKVVQRGGADKLFINTAGVGVIPAGFNPSAGRAQAGDVVIVNGWLGDHGAAILNARGDLALDADIETDCAPLNRLVEAMFAACPDIHCLRDATRGGLATVLNEFAERSSVDMLLKEAALPIRTPVRGMCEILGLDPLYLANEGKLVAVVPADTADAVLAAMQRIPEGYHACIIGTVEEGDGHVILKTAFGGERIVDMLPGEQLPRIC